MSRTSFWIGLVCLLSSLLVFSCSRKSGEPRIFNDKVIPVSELLALTGYSVTGKLAYAQVNRDWLLWVYNDYRSWISEGGFGVVKWDDKAQCTFFVTSFEVFAQKRYFAHAFHSRIDASGIAIGPVWYRPDPAVNIGHAVCACHTQNGVEYFDPQTGKFVILTPAQLAAVYFRKFD